MDKLFVYFDSDGVIFDTMETGKRLASQKGYNADDFWELHDFFVQADWYELLYEAGIIDNAIRKIKMILSNENIEGAILTKKCGADTEEHAKLLNYRKLLPDIPVITLDLDEHKDEVVNPVNSILIDDSISNIKRWRDAGGIGILFNKHFCDLENDIIDDLLKFMETKSVKEFLYKDKNKQLVRSINK